MSDGDGDREMEARKRRATALLPKLSKAVDLTEEELQHALIEIGLDPYAEFLSDVFKLSSRNDHGGV